MKLRGRPRTNGLNQNWVLHCTAVALLGYDKARSSGREVRAALRAAVEEVRQIFPDMPMFEAGFTEFRESGKTLGNLIRHNNLQSDIDASFRRKFKSNLVPKCLGASQQLTSLRLTRIDKEAKFLKICCESNLFGRRTPP